jgi:hypothetical protein
MKQMLSYRTVLIAQTGICSGIPLMALRSTPQSLASSISALMTSSPQCLSYIPQPETGNICTELKGRAAAFKQRDSNPDAYKKSRYSLRRIIKQAKKPIQD